MQSELGKFIKSQLILSKGYYACYKLMYSNQCLGNIKTVFGVLFTLKCSPAVKAVELQSTSPTPPKGYRPAEAQHKEAKWRRQQVSSSWICQKTV